MNILPFRTRQIETRMAPISRSEEIIEEARTGRMFILADDEDRENEGDIIVPAAFASAFAINFMAQHARGLVCLAITPEHAARLSLAPMTAVSTTKFGTAFTVSIEARDGVTTGISAHDRARTIAVAIDPQSTPRDILTPGHMFPLVARHGGVLARPGHTEAAVDVSRLAGLDPSGVLCEIMSDDGTMARLPELRIFAARHALKVGTVADLVQYRRRMERV